MKFLNKKEQVIDLEITPYGKSLLSMGRFKPVYYAFFDDDVLYDSEYAGFTEHQNSASVRIRDAFNLETQAFFYSAEEQVRQATAFHRLTSEEKKIARDYGNEPVDTTGTPYVQNDDVTIGTISDQEFEGQPLGNSALNSSFAPAWNINVIESLISSSTETLSSLDLPIPQINMTSSMFEFTLTENQVGGNFYQFDHPSIVPTNPLKNKFLNVVEKSIILEIDEDNTNYEWENFDIEVLEVENVDYPHTQITKQFMKPKYFKKSISQVQNGILLNADEIPVMNSPTDPRYAEYFLSMDVDSQIDQKLLCDKARNRGEGLYGQRTLPCDDKQKQRDVNIEQLYESDDEECE